MKKAKGRFIGGFYGLSPISTYSEDAPSMKMAYSGVSISPIPKLASYLSRYGFDKRFLRTSSKQTPGVSYQPGQGN